MKTKILNFKVKWLLLPLVLMLTYAQAWGGEIRDVENIVSGNQYRIKTAMGSTYYLVISNASGGNGGVTTTESDGTIFTFTYENPNWYITFTKDAKTQYLYTEGSTNGKVYYTTTKTAVSWIKNYIIGDGHYLLIGHTVSTTDWYLQSNNSDRLGTYSSNQNKIILVDANPCTDPATPLAVTSGASVTMGSTMTLTANAGNGGTKSWSVVPGTGSATISGTTLTPVTPGTVTVKVHQNLNGTYCSQDAEKVVTINKREATITLNEAGSETSVSGTFHELDSYTLPTTAASCGDKVLVGWSKVAIPDPTSKPTTNYYAKGTSYTLEPGSNYFYAVYATSTEGTGDWELYTESTIVEGDYLIEQSDYAMENTRDSYYRIIKNYVSITNGVIVYSPSDESWSDLTWHIAGTGTPNVFTIKNGSNYLIATGSASQADFTSSPTDSKELFEITYQSSSQTYKIVSKYNEQQSITQKYLRNAGSYFACYADGTYPHLFKRGNAYSDYTTYCCEKPNPALSITGSNTVVLGNTLTLSTSGGNGNSVTWSVTAGTGDATIAAGVLTPSSQGTVTVKAHQDAKNDACPQDAELVVTITKSVSSVSVDPTTKLIIIQETFQITPSITPADATNLNVSWSSSATGKATVNDGVVTGVAAGSATITCTTEDGGKTATCAVTVYDVTLAVKDESNNDISGTVGLPTRSGINISPAADAGGYIFKEWQISNAVLGSSATTKANTITNPSNTVTVTAVYWAKNAVTWMVNGEVYSTEAVAHGTQYKDLTWPADPDADDYCGDKFAGWTTDATMIANGSTMGQSAPDPLITSANRGSNTTAVESAVTFHAVFANFAN